MDTLLARQPIFDAAERIIGYHLSYRDCDPEVGGHTVLDALLDIGVDRLTHQRVAFINLTPELLLTRAVELLDHRGVVLVVPGDAESPRLLARCEELRARGYHLAVDVDPLWSPSDALLRLAEAARFFVPDFPGSELTRAVRELGAGPLHLLADGVENRAMRDRCLALGFHMFQGLLFTRPEIVERRDIGVEHAEIFRLLRDIGDPSVPDARLVEAFQHDPSLTFKLLRVANSAAVSGGGIESVGHAVRLLGRDALSRWLSLLLLSTRAGRGVDAEISASALMRARFCELLAAPLGRREAADSLFTVGLLSQLDLLLHTPLDHVLELISLTGDIRRALLERAGPFGGILALVEGCEAGRWDEVTSLCEEVGFDPSELSPLYLEALAWAQLHGAVWEDGADAETPRPSGGPAAPEHGPPHARTTPRPIPRRGLLRPFLARTLFPLLRRLGLRTVRP